MELAIGQIRKFSGKLW